MSALGNISRDPLVYICGEAYLKNSTESPSLRDIIISNLAVFWAVRTHQTAACVDTRNGTNDDLFRVIRSSSVFVFIFSKKTLDDGFFLNQYGMAKSYDIPVVGVRLTNYFLHSPLPEQYFRTEIVDNSNCASSRNVPEATRNKVSLADHLINDFKSAMVYGPDFHRSCIERLTHKVAQAYNKRENEKAFVERAVKHVSKSPLENIKRNECPKTADAKCPKCGFLVRDFLPPKLQRASSTGSLLQRSNTLMQLPCKVTAATRNGRTPLQTSKIQIPSPRPVKISQKTENTPYGNWTFKHDPQPKIQAKPGLVLSSESPNKEEAKLSTNESPTNPKVFRRQSRASNESWTERLRNKLRRQSSLPVIPTTYLVTTPDGIEKQISLVKYPPEKRDILSPRGSDNMTMFSEDEDQETIHISRVPSPDVPSG